MRHPEILAAAREAAEQLEAITNGLGSIAYAHKDAAGAVINDPGNN